MSEKIKVSKARRDASALAVEVGEELHISESSPLLQQLLKIQVEHMRLEELFFQTLTV